MLGVTATLENFTQKWPGFQYKFNLGSPSSTQVEQIRKHIIENKINYLKIRTKN